MTSKGKSFAQELAELFNPAPAGENDPDALDLGDGAKLVSDDEFEEAQRQPSRRAPEKAMLLRGDIVLEDAVYRGRKTSRAALFGGDEGDTGLASDDSGDGDDDEGLGLELGSDQDEVEGEEEEEEEEEGRPARGKARGGPAGPSGRAATAAAGKDKGSRQPGLGKGKAAPAGLASSDLESSGAGEDEDEDLEGEEEEKEEDLSGSQEEEEDVEMGVEEEEDGAGRQAARRPKASKAAAKKRDGGGGGVAGDNELDALEAELEALQEEDDRQLVALRQKSERDRVQGAAVRNQQVLYERALEQRILLQKCLQASNGLPRPETHALLVRSQPEVRDGFAQLAAAARSTLDQLLHLQRTLMARTPAITLPAPEQQQRQQQPPATADAINALSSSGRDHQSQHRQQRTRQGGAKRSREEAEDEEDEEGGEEEGASDLEGLWQRINSHHEALAPYRDASLDSWHRRTVLSSGSGALRNSGLRALNQSISSQVQALMRDPAKFIKRTRLTLSTCPRVLCEPSRAGAGASTANTSLGADPTADDDAADGPGATRATATIPSSSSVAADVVEEERDGETYDDSEFYQQLLKEFLDKGLAQGSAANAPKAAKKRKVVDRRASKGRKLRYHVQEKLVAFMAPVDFEPPPFAANLFSNLFGHAGK